MSSEFLNIQIHQNFICYFQRMMRLGERKWTHRTESPGQQLWPCPCWRQGHQMSGPSWFLEQQWPVLVPHSLLSLTCAWAEADGALTTSNSSSSCLTPVSATSPLKSPCPAPMVVFQFPSSLCFCLSSTYKPMTTFSLKFTLCGPQISFFKFRRHKPER